MKKTIISYSIFTLFLAIFCLSCKNLIRGKESTNLPDNELYQKFCASCHGKQLQHFKRLKSYEKSETDLFSIIKNGNTKLGMPEYGESMTDDQIKYLTKYIQEFDYKKNHIPNADPEKYEVIVDGLEIPWGFAFLPNGDMLIAEKKGVLSRFNAKDGMKPITGLPMINDEGQGGLMEVKLHPDYESNGWIYIAYSYQNLSNTKLTNTAIIRGKLSDQNALTDIESIYKGTPGGSTRRHYGTRIVFNKDNQLYFSNGDRGQRDDFPQKLNNSNGKIHRLNDDGTVPADNPFVNEADAIPSIYSYGHRNPQGLALHPTTGQLWVHEHGPRGGDEINIIKKGANYGWPVISYGINYTGTKFTDITTQEGMEQPVHYYKPSIAPCGMAFLDSNIYPKWKGNLFIGSLSFGYLERIELKDNQVVYQERLLKELDSRVRDVKVGPDGYLYVSLENPGRIIKLVQ